MRRGAINHNKIRALMKAMQLPQYAVIGLIECLWSFTRRYGRDRDISRWTNAEIARGVTWDGDADQLIAALIQTKWLKRSPSGALRFVHLRVHNPEVPTRIRREVLSVGRCGRCGARDDLTIDHINPVVLGGSNLPSNLQCLCRSCNSRKGMHGA